MDRVVIIGGGFAGLSAAKALRRANVQLTLIDRRNFHLFQPLLYQVATGGLSPANIAAPLREILKRQRNVQTWLGNVVDIDATNRVIHLQEKAQVLYDWLIVAAGATHNYFGHSEWAQRAPGLKTLEDATEIRRRIFLAFERAEQELNLQQRAAWLTFVIVGAGPTGLELAGALAEIARDTLRHNFRAINSANAQIILIEATDRVLPPYDPRLSARAASTLARLGIQVLSRAVVGDIQNDHVIVEKDEHRLKIPARTVLWAAGVQASPLGGLLARATGCELDKAGRVIVQPDLTVLGHPEIFVVGDLTHFRQNGQPLPGLAPVAMRQGVHAARQVMRRLQGQPTTAFRYPDLGTMATIGRAHAVAQLNGLRLWGWP
ncbi:MAG: NAD(P)/FAD-dependent oxidoreductase, partial [Candidatus Omnitrophica bacterium]|nr:NAD(P)/FAD-dependent oxidoreductase [Candidatus Omnitrophota bacterium]MBI3009896.1 NAD(P)/FAD-dependent oxidoreductase [Candidatus Omnitrophota bacterium]